MRRTPHVCWRTRCVEPPRRKRRKTVGELVTAIPDLRFIDAGPLENARIIESITALLIGINRRYKTDRAGIKMTGLPPM